MFCLRMGLRAAEIGLWLPLDDVVRGCKVRDPVKYVCKCCLNKDYRASHFLDREPEAILPAAAQMH